MLGRSHAISGATLWLGVSAATAISAPLTGAYSLTPLFLGGAVAAGAAMLPDLDHPTARAANLLPPMTNGISRAVGKISGGHRQATHSVLGLAIVILLAELATWLTVDVGTLTVGDAHLAIGEFQLGAAIAAFLIVGLGMTTMLPSKPLGWIAAAFGFVVVGLYSPDDHWWLPLAVGIGYLAHMVGDAMTHQMIPWLWPLKPKPPRSLGFWKRSGNFGFPVLGATGSGREKVFVSAMALYSGAVVVLKLFS
jgi:membrane-bound metal-dependent hydrolase YbcI (DUF457 family)